MHELLPNEIIIPGPYHSYCCSWRDRWCVMEHMAHWTLWSRAKLHGEMPNQWLFHMERRFRLAVVQGWRCCFPCAGSCSRGKTTHVIDSTRRLRQRRMGVWYLGKEWFQVHCQDPQQDCSRKLCKQTEYRTAWYPNTFISPVTSSWESRLARCEQSWRSSILSWYAVFDVNVMRHSDDFPKT